MKIDGHGREVVNLVVYRICSDSDAIFHQEAYTNGEFMSTCASLNAARMMLQRPPNPRANQIVQLTVTGKVLDMVYDDGYAGYRKSHEEEIIVPVSNIQHVQVIN